MIPILPQPDTAGAINLTRKLASGPASTSPDTALAAVGFVVLRSFTAPAIVTIGWEGSNSKRLEPARGLEPRTY